MRARRRRIHRGDRGENGRDRGCARSPRRGGLGHARSLADVSAAWVEGRHGGKWRNWIRSATVLVFYLPVAQCVISDLMEGKTFRRSG
jgi:hypothetical protein